LFTPKILVEIIHKNLDSSKKKCKIIENKVQIQKGSKGRGKIGWTPTFTKDSILEMKSKPLLYLKLRTLTQKKLMVLEGSEKCLDFIENKDVELNGLTRQSLKELSDLEVIKRSGDVRVKHELPFVFWLLVALGAGVLILQIMQMRGVYFG